MDVRHVFPETHGIVKFKLRMKVGNTPGYTSLQYPEKQGPWQTITAQGLGKGMPGELSSPVLRVGRNPSPVLRFLFTVCECFAYMYHM